VVGFTAISTLATLNWAAGVVGVDVGVTPGVGVAELLPPPPHAVIAKTITQEHITALIKCLDAETFFNIVLSRRRLIYFPGKEENSDNVSQG
jgi:hypothetical protein